jgi:hypothetical protein
MIPSQPKKQDLPIRTYYHDSKPTKETRSTNSDILSWFQANQRNKIYQFGHIIMIPSQPKKQDLPIRTYYHDSKPTKETRSTNSDILSWFQANQRNKIYWCFFVYLLSFKYTFKTDGMFFFSWSEFLPVLKKWFKNKIR